MLHAKSDSRSDTLDYLQTMLGQLRAMAEAERLGDVARLIEMAYLEANEAVRAAEAQSARGASDTRPPG